MTKISTKKALMLSLLSMLICVSMLVGSTFAWFTDTATVAVNSIQSGTLDVALEMFDNGAWVNAKGETLSFKKASTASGEEVLWEPGCTYDLESFRIKNNGNLALKYKVIISGLVGSAKLLEAIDFTVAVEGTALVAKDSNTASPTTVADLNNFEGTLDANAVTGKITITGHMKEEAGNDYQDKTIDGIAITVVATQLNKEYDSEGNEYDKDVELITAEELRKIFLNDDGSLKSSVTLDKDYLLTDEWTPINPTANYKDNVIDGQGHTIYNMSVSKGSNNAGFIGYNTDKLTIKNLTFSNANISGPSYLGVVIGNQYGKVTLENVHVVNSTVKGSGGQVGHIGGLVGFSAVYDSACLTLKNCSVENSEFEGYHNTCGLVGSLMWYTATPENRGEKSVSDCVVSGCHFKWTCAESSTWIGNNFSTCDGFADVTCDGSYSGVTATDNTYEYGS